MARKPRGRPINGWIVLDKPLGMSSSQAVGKVRWLLDAAKAGHGGTLDPLATGILPIALGEATKTVSFAMDGRKTYRFTIAWGSATATEDAEGAVVATSEVRPTEAQITAVLPAFTGRLTQRPPAYSALKIDGKRAYDLARAGEEVVLKDREVDIFALRFLGAPDRDAAIFEADVGKGTYIRALGRDIALALGTVGHLSALRRTRVGAFTEETAISLEKLELLGHIPAAFEHLLPVMTALDDIPALAVTEAEAVSLRHGRLIEVPSPSGAGPRGLPRDGIVCVTWRSEPIALASLEGGRLRPVRVLNP